MAAAPHREFSARLPCQGNDAADVRCIGDADDRRGPTVEAGKKDAAHVVVSGVVRADHLAVQTGAEVEIWTSGVVFTCSPSLGTRRFMRQRVFTMYDETERANVTWLPRRTRGRAPDSDAGGGGCAGWRSPHSLSVPSYEGAPGGQSQRSKRPYRLAKRACPWRNFARSQPRLSVSANLADVLGRDGFPRPPSAMPDGGELLGQAAAERRQECENA